MSLKVDLEPGKTVHVKLVKTGYLTQEFDYTVPHAAATVTKTMVAEVCEAKITKASLDKKEYEPGERAKFDFTVQNTGNVTTNIVINLGIDTPKYLKTIYNSKPGDTHSDTAYIPVPNTPGSYEVIITVEACGKETDRKELPFTVKLKAVTITFETKKEDGTILTGVEVWIDGVKKGTT
ncbi:MAG: hypothetical protein ACXQTD_04295 [Candidatus Syntropharchaeia archaeon]